MFRSWKRFSQWVFHIQIRMYFAKFYVSILNVITNGVEAALDVLGLLVKPGLLGYRNCTSVVTKDSHSLLPK